MSGYEENWTALGHAIIDMAAHDWMKAWKKKVKLTEKLLVSNDPEEIFNLRRKLIDKQTRIDDCESFFLGEDIKCYIETDGKTILRKLKEKLKNDLTGHS